MKQRFFFIVVTPRPVDCETIRSTYPTCVLFCGTVDRSKADVTKRGMGNEVFDVTFNVSFNV